MPKLNGFIKVHRKLVVWGWYKDYVVKDLFLHLLLTAAYKESEWLGRPIKKGQLVTSYGHLAEELGFSVKQIRTALDKLKSTGEVASTSTNKYTLITVVNWEEYQSFEYKETSKKASNVANEGQTKGKQRANEGQHLKNIKNTNKIKEKKNTPPASSSDELSAEERERIYRELTE